MKKSDTAGALLSSVFWAFFAFPAFALDSSGRVESSVAQAGEPVRVVTLNILYDRPKDGLNRWACRRDTVCEFFNEQADVGGMQEVLNSQWKSIRERTPDFDGFFRVSGEEPNGSSMGNAVLWRKDRFKRVADGVVWLSETPDLPGASTWGGKSARTALWVDLEDRTDGTRWRFICSHFESGESGEEARVKSAPLVTGLAKDFQGAVVFMADCNALPSSKALGILKSQGRLTDSWTGPEQGTFNNFQEGPFEGRIDYILHNNAVEVLEPLRIWQVRTEWGGWISDHFPVFAVMKAAKLSERPTP